MAADGVPAIDFAELQGWMRIYQERGRRVMGELSPAIAESMHHEVLEMFETEGHGKWPGFWWQRAGLPAPGSTKAKKKGKKGKLSKSNRRWQGNPKLLQDTGNLVGSMTPEWDEHIVEVYTNVPYAKYHASREPRHVIPLRDFFDIDVEAFEQDVVDMMLLRLTRPEAA
jgi:phage gpG-like protein